MNQWKYKVCYTSEGQYTSQAFLSLIATHKAVCYIVFSSVTRGNLKSSLNHVYCLRLQSPQIPHWQRFNRVLKTLQDGCGSNHHSVLRKKNHNWLRETRNTTSTETKTQHRKHYWLSLPSSKVVTQPCRHNTSQRFKHPEAQDVQFVSKQQYRFSQQPINKEKLLQHHRYFKGSWQKVKHWWAVRENTLYNLPCVIWKINVFLNSNEWTDETFVLYVVELCSHNHVQTKEIHKFI